MCFRLLRICDTEELFEKRAAELKNDFLMPRGYKSRLIEAQFDRVRKLPGENYLQKRKLALEKRVKKTHQIELLESLISIQFYLTSVLFSINTGGQWSVTTQT